MLHTIHDSFFMDRMHGKKKTRSAWRVETFKKNYSVLGKKNPVITVDEGMFVLHGIEFLEILRNIFTIEVA